MTLFKAEEVKTSLKSRLRKSIYSTGYCSSVFIKIEQSQKSVEIAVARNYRGEYYVSATVGVATDCNNYTSFNYSPHSDFIRNIMTDKIRGTVKNIYKLIDDACTQSLLDQVEALILTHYKKEEGDAA